MEPQFNFKIKSTLPCSTLCKTNGLRDFISLGNHLKKIPYGRTKHRSDYCSVLIENKGTCSTKHAFLKQIAIENNIQNIQLYIGIYKMNDANTKGVGNVLKSYNLEYIPEAHTYLKINKKTVDITRAIISREFFKDSLLTETKILPNDIGDFKIEFHQKHIKQWLLEEKINSNFETVWRIRELCIAALSP